MVLVVVVVYLSICKLENEAILRDFLSPWTWQHQKRNNSARLPQFLNLTTSKRKQVCETSSVFEVDNNKNETILRDFLQEWKVECRADGLVPMRFAIFPLQLSKVLRLPGKSDARSYEVLHLSRKIIFPKLKIWCSKMYPLSGNQRPDLLTSLMSMSLSCTAPATRNASFRILFKCSTPIVFETATKPSRFAHSWQGAHSLAPATRNGIWMSKVVRACGVCNILISTCASRNNGVHFFDIPTSKSALSPSVFYTFDLEICFAPQRRALFRHRNFYKCSEADVFCAFLLRNVLRATTACNFSTSQLRKVLRSWGVFSFFTCKCASRHNGVQFFISHLASWLRTRRFSEPTFRPSGATNHWKNTVFRDFPTFSCTWIFFLRTLSLLWLFPPLLFICPYCRKFDF